MNVFKLLIQRCGSAVQSILQLVDGCETWSVAPREKTQIVVFESKLLGRKIICGVKMLTKTSNLVRGTNRAPAGMHPFTSLTCL
jgi:hypothetical protein